MLRRRETRCLLSPERASFCETSLSTSRLTQHRRAAGTNDDSLGMREDGRDSEATRTFDIHEERAGFGDKLLELVFACLGSRGWVEEVYSENHLELCYKFSWYLEFD